MSYLEMSCLIETCQLSVALISDPRVPTLVSCTQDTSVLDPV